MIFHSCIKLSDGMWLAVQNWADLGLGLGPMATAQDPRYRKRPPLRMASVDQGCANRDSFPSSLSLEPNGHISASCHCHPLSIRSGLAPSSQLLRPKLHAQSALLRRHWTICLTPGQWCAECPGVTVVCLDALWVRRTGRKAGRWDVIICLDRLSELVSERTTSILLHKTINQMQCMQHAVQ